MAFVTWEDVTPYPSTVEIDREANTMTVTINLPLFGSGFLLANLPRPPMRHQDDQAKVLNPS
jgi:hypothetical protein